ncbi:MAG: HEAT repeat domain-containing protein [Planctomycetota bacterium]
MFKALSAYYCILILTAAALVQDPAPGAPPVIVEIEGSVAAHRTEAPIAGTDREDLFQGETHGGRFSVIFRVPPGEYHLELGFAEIFWDAAGQRVFDVNVQGKPLLEQFDIFKEAGASYRAIKKETPASAGADGIRVEFIPRENRAKFSYLKLTSAKLATPIQLLGGGLEVSGATLARVQKDLLPKAPEGFEVSVVAQDPDITFPTVIAAEPSRADGTGILYVAEDYYNGIANVENEKPDLDRILRLELDAETGKATKITQYAAGFGSIQGLCYTNNTLFVAAAPEVVALKDNNNDGVPDERTVILSNCGPAPGDFSLRHHIPSGLHRGVDGKLMLSIGDHGCNATNRFGDKAVLEGGGSIRFDQDGRGLEIFTSGLRNTLHHSENAYGEWFTRDNTNDGDGWDARLFHLIPKGNYGYPYLFKSYPDEILKPIGEYGGGSSTGNVVYQETTFPKRYHGALFAADWARRELYAIALKENGATYQPQIEVFLSQDEGGVRDFRPSGVITDDRGDLLIADWSHNGWGESPKIGRILRIRAKNAQRPPNVEFNNWNDAFSALADARRSVRDQAFDYLLKTDEPKFLDTLAASLRESTSTLQIIHCIWLAVRKFKAAAVPQLSELLQDKNTYVEAQAARALGELRDARAIGYLSITLLSTRPFARREAAIALGNIGIAAAPVLLQHLNDPDPRVGYCIIQSLKQCGGFEAASGKLTNDDDLVSNRAFAVVADVTDSVIVQKLAVIAKDAARPIHRIRALDALGRIALLETPWNGKDWWGTQPQSARPKIHRWEGSEVAIATIATSLASENTKIAEAALAAAEESPASEYVGGIGKLCEKAAEPVLDRAIRLLRKLKSADAANVLIKISQRANVNIETRCRAISQLRHFDDAAVITNLVNLTKDANPAFRAAAAGALELRTGASVRTALRSLLNDPDENVLIQTLESYQKTEDANAIPDLLKHFRGGSEAVRMHAARAVIRHSKVNQEISKNMEMAALDAVQDPGLRELSLQILLNVASRASLHAILKIAASEQPLGRSQRTLALSVCEKIIGKGAPAAGADDAALDRWFDWAKVNITDFSEPPRADAGAARKRIANLTKAGLNGGDAARGKVIFFDPKGAACFRCHQIGGEGEKVGPELTGIATKYSRQFLIESILEPSRIVHGGYEASVFEIDGMPPVSGTVIFEDNNTVEVVTGPGQKQKLQKDKVKARFIQPISPMPAGLIDALKETEFGDLLEYLASQK